MAPAAQAIGDAPSKREARPASRSMTRKARPATRARAQVRKVKPVARVAQRTEAKHVAPRRTVKRSLTRRAARPAAGVERVIAFAMAQVGESYEHGGSGNGGWDCSGLTKAAFAKIGVSLPHSSGGQHGHGRYVSPGDRRRGDLMLWNGHAAIYLGGDRMVSAANSDDGVKTQEVWGSPEYRRF